MPVDASSGNQITEPFAQPADVALGDCVAAIVQILEGAGFEEIGAPFMLPVVRGEEGAFYPCSASHSDGMVWLRAFGTAFNLVPRAAFRAGLHRVFSVGPGINRDRPEVAEVVVLIQWFGASARQAGWLLAALARHAHAVRHDTAVIHGRSCSRFAVRPAALPACR